MKSAFAATIAAAALITSSESARVFVFKPGQATTAKIEETIINDCNKLSNPQRAWAPNPNGKAILYMLDTTQDSCVPSSTAAFAYTELTGDELTDALKCFPSGTYSAGASAAYCPIAFGKKCTATTQLCQNYAKADVPCVPTDGICRYPEAKMMLVGESTFAGPWEAYKTPTPVILAMMGSISQYCPVVDLQKPVSMPSKNANKISQGFAVVDPTKCQTDPIATAVKAAIDQYNASDAAKEAPYPALAGTFSTITAENYMSCYNTASNAFECLLTSDNENCAIPCPNGTECTNDNECGGRCVVDPAAPDSGVTICQSNSFAAVVAPVLAAVLALAFF